MTRKSIIIGVVCGVLIGSLAIYLNMRQAAQALHSEAPTITFPQDNKSEQSPSEVLETILNSHTNWQTLQGEISIWDYGGVAYQGDGQVQKSTIEIAVKQPDKLYAQSQNQSFNSHFVQVIDGNQSCEVDVQRTIYTCISLSKELLQRDLSRLPQNLNAVHEQSEDGIPIIHPHPMALLTSPPIAEMIYPTALAQRRGEYLQAEPSEYLNREVWIVDWQQRNEENRLVAKERMWVDQRTGVILKSQRFAGPTFEQVNEEITFTSIAFNQAIDAATFDVAPWSDMQEVDPNEFYSVPAGVGTRDSE